MAGNVRSLQAGALGGRLRSEILRPAPVTVVARPSAGADPVTVRAHHVALSHLRLNGCKRGNPHKRTDVCDLVPQMVKLQHPQVRGPAISARSSDQVGDNPLLVPGHHGSGANPANLPARVVAAGCAGPVGRPPAHPTLRLPPAPARGVERKRSHRLVLGARRAAQQRFHALAPSTAAHHAQSHVRAEPRRVSGFVTSAGFEPAPSTLKGWHPDQLDDEALGEQVVPAERIELSWPLRPPPFEDGVSTSSTTQAKQPPRA